METKDMISQFIQKERSSTRQLHLNGVYSLEFALGLLAGLNNLAGFYGLRSVTEDIRGDIEYLGQ
ncbi:hypothetical protein ACFQ88_22615 [Paenibacillus sp. NPDC056579]|uniref:hypothetical protein n=1 Tax=Paenibacillus sp. NPDC056579 TaxID=3345871 RepID=UPI0036B0C349